MGGRKGRGREGKGERERERRKEKEERVRAGVQSGVLADVVNVCLTHHLAAQCETATEHR